MRDWNELDTPWDDRIRQPVVTFNLGKLKMQQMVYGIERIVGQSLYPMHQAELRKRIAALRQSLDIS